MYVDLEMMLTRGKNCCVEVTSFLARSSINKLSESCMNWLKCMKKVRKQFSFVFIRASTGNWRERSKLLLCFASHITRKTSPEQFWQNCHPTQSTSMKIPVEVYFLGTFTSLSCLLSVYYIIFSCFPTNNF